MAWQDHITVDPEVCHGKACIKGTRVLVSVVVDNLADRETPEASAATYRITADDVRAVLEYAAELLRERVVRLPGAA